MARPHAVPRKHGDRAIEIASRLCECGHSLETHHGGDCLHCEIRTLKFCKCREYRPLKSVKR